MRTIAGWMMQEARLPTNTLIRPQRHQHDLQKQKTQQQKADSILSCIARMFVAQSSLS
jgi:hypothetical protein